MAAVSAYHLIRRTPDFAIFRTSLRIGVVTAALAITLVQGFGFAQFGPVGAVQPTKFGSGADADALIAEWTARFGPGDYTPPVLANVGLGFMILIGMGLGALWLLLPCSGGTGSSGCASRSGCCCSACRCRSSR